MKIDITNTKRQLLKLRLSIRSKALLTKARAKLLETFIKPVSMYSSSIGVYPRVDGRRLEFIQNTVRRMILGLYSSINKKN